MADNIPLLESLLAAYNSHDVDAVVGHFTPDAVYEAPLGPGPEGAVHRGRDAIRVAVAARFAASPDIRWEPESHASTSAGGASSWVVSWTDPSGRPVRHRGCDLFVVESGKVARKDSFFKQIINPEESK